MNNKTRPSPTKLLASLKGRITPEDYTALAEMMIENATLRSMKVRVLRRLETCAQAAAKANLIGHEGGLRAAAAIIGEEAT